MVWLRSELSKYIYDLYVNTKDLYEDYNLGMSTWQVIKAYIDGIDDIDELDDFIYQCCRVYLGVK